ncbi:MAG: DUF362 domain-containing protein [Chitinispirillaceae bacterium]|nr:DUF362 domain-containing protein [Chitinispirillaceae bacterium]
MKRIAKNNAPSPGRRTFLKQVAAATAGAAAAGVPIPAAAAPGSSWTDRKPVNPAIDNLRVVCCHDPAMVTGNYIRGSMAAQNAPVVATRVHANLDGMAKALAQKNSAAEAWQTIFQKPAAKEWSAVRVAIKLNCKTNNGTPNNNPRIAIIEKVCMVLHTIGVAYENITLYDADDEDASALYADFIGNGIPSGVRVSEGAALLGGKTAAPVPAPSQGTSRCVRDIANGTIDILINISVNKGHQYVHPGYCTLSMKNHLGTFDPQPHETDYVIAINKSDAILGGTPVRQQLCIVDSLWANVAHNHMTMPDAANHRLIMGTFGPAVDYCTVKKVREDILGATHENSVIARFLTDFGYQASEAATTFVNVDPVPLGSRRQQRRTGTLVVFDPQGREAGIFGVTIGAGPVAVTVSDLQGRIVAGLPVVRQGNGTLSARWDGQNRTRRGAESGTYLFTVQQNGTARSKRIHLIR